MRNSQARRDGWSEVWEERRELVRGQNNAERKVKGFTSEVIINEAINNAK